MPAQLLELDAVQYRSAVVRDLDVKEGVVDILAAPYESEADIGPFTEIFSKGTFSRAAKNPSRLGLWAEHGGPLVGRAFEAEDTDDGFVMRCKVSQTTAGKDLLVQLDDGTLSAASVEFDPMRDFMAITERAGKLHVRHRRAHLRGCAVVFEGAYDGARVLAVRDAERERAQEEYLLWLEKSRRRWN